MSRLVLAAPAAVGCESCGVRPVAVLVVIGDEAFRVCVDCAAVGVLAGGVTPERDEIEAELQELRELREGLRRVFPRWTRTEQIVPLVEAFRAIVARRHAAEVSEVTP